MAQLWRSKLPAIVAKHSPVDANPRHRLVAVAIAAVVALETRMQSSATRADSAPEQLTAFGLIAEIGDFKAFSHPKQLASFLSPVPSEQSTGQTGWQGAILKAGSSYARRPLIEAAWHYRHRPAISLTLRRRQQDQPAAAVAGAWRAQLRLSAGWAHLTRCVVSAAPPSPSHASSRALSGRSPVNPTDAFNPARSGWR